MRSRLRSTLATATLDTLALGLAYCIALAIRNAVASGGPIPSGSIVLDWTFLIMLVVTMSSFMAFGLYSSEVHVHRPLLLRTLIKGVSAAFIISSVTVFFIKSTEVTQSRFLLIGTFGLFALLVTLLRLSINVRAYRRQVAEQKPIVLVIGQSPRSHVLECRLSHLWGFSRWKSVVASGGVREYSLATAAELDAAAASGRAVQAVFIDQGGMPLQGVLPLVEQVRARRCCEV
jgi:hypothetical protein